MKRLRGVTGDDQREGYQTEALVSQTNRPSRGR